jgi:hypothetical protein
MARGHRLHHVVLGVDDLNDKRILGLSFVVAGRLVEHEALELTIGHLDSQSNKKSEKKCIPVVPGLIPASQQRQCFQREWAFSRGRISRDDERIVPGPASPGTIQSAATFRDFLQKAIYSPPG